MLTSTKELLSKAHKKNYAVPAFNINNLETLKAVVEASAETRSPAIVQTSEGAIKYAGLLELSFLARLEAAKNKKAKVALHFDHGKDVSLLTKATKLGYSSVMIDASELDFEKNIEKTRSIVRIAHKYGLTVEAELGTIGGREDKVHSKQIILTDPAKAKEFIKRTKCDFLAVAIGTSHGASKSSFFGKSLSKKAKAPKLDIERLNEIKKNVNIPLVLHGASNVPKEEIAKLVKYGGKVKGAIGNPDSEIKKAIKSGINKINIDTDLRVAFLAGLREYLKKNPDDIDMRHYLNAGKEEMKKVIKHKFKLFGCYGKA